MDERSANPSPQTMRQPFSDASNRMNNTTPRIERQEFFDVEQDDMKSPDRMSIVTSPLSPKNNMDYNCLTPLADSRAGSNRNSTISAASIRSGRGKMKTHVGPWQLGRTLGNGATGRVRLAKHAVTGQTAAIKIVSKKSAAMVQSESIAAMDKTAGRFADTGARQMPCGIEREVVIMKLVEHPNVISLYDVWENRGELYLVLEYVEGGELFEYVSHHGPLPEELAVRMFRQIIAGLGYCHRFNICHRDLKPENILLDSHHNVKLADFGMAALQPAGHWLNTSCGSPHYAAPEIIYGQRYRGDRADIWSCGIILYALLMGYLPFDGGEKLSDTLKAVKRGRYDIPGDVSDEAADLIQRILQKKPENRISIQNMWMHPLLRKYEKLHQAMSNHHLGPPPPLSVDDCGEPLRGREYLDLDLLRNLQTLWHGVKLDVLIERLLSTEPNHERMFYNSLVKFRDEQLENYQGQPLEYSGSDYHHISRPPGQKKRNYKNRLKGSSFRHSQLVLKDARRQSSIQEPISSGTVESYDPFRSPYNRAVEEKPQSAQVTVHRDVDLLSPKQSVAEAGKPEHDDLVEDPDEDTEDCPPSSPLEIVRERRPKPPSMKSFHSKMSTASSRRFYAGQTPRSASYKRNVSFHHIRNRSQGSAKVKSTPAKQMDHKQPSEISFKMVMESSPLMTRHESPALPAQPTVVRGVGISMKNSPQIKKLRDSEFTWKDDARKVSHELSQICEEAFNGTSMSTGCTTSTCTGSETPATSVSIASPENSQNQIASHKARTQNGSGVPPSGNSVNDLTETRRKLIEHSTKDGSDSIPGYISGVITHLDRLIEQDQTKQAEQPDYGDRVRSLPDPFKSSDPGYLPIISEELVTPYGSGNDITARQLEQRCASQSTSGSNSRDGKATIRMVPQDSLRSLDMVKPLTIRKKSQNKSTEQDAQQEQKFDSKSDGTSRYVSASPLQWQPCELDPIEENPRSPKRSDARGSDKKWSWFRRKSQMPGESPPKPKEVKPIQPSTGTVVHHPVDTEQPPAQETGKTKEPVSEKPKGGFLKKLLKRKPSKTAVKEKPAAPAPVNTNPTNTNTLQRQGTENDDSFESDSSQKPLPPKPRPGKNQNWFARVLQIKPATRVIALNIPKVKARKEVYKILRDWKQYGVEEVYMHRGNSYIYGRVGEDNFLRLRPVELSAEFYTFLEHGRQANISLVRFRQERGAASSFNKVIDALHMVMKQKKVLVEDPARAKKMARLLDTLPN